MLNAQNKWPLAFSRVALPVYFLILAAIFLVLLALDRPVTVWAGAHLSGWRPVFEIVTIPGNSKWTLVPLLALMALAFIVSRFLPKGTRRIQATTIASVATFLFAGVALPGILSNLVKRLVGRARPTHFEEFGIAHFQPFSDWSFQSFPSGDTTTVFATAAVVMFFLPNFGRVLLIGAALVGFARIVLGVHFPTDVYGGVLFGTFGAYAVRNFCASRGWLFTQTADGRFVPALNWPSAYPTAAR